MPAVKSPSPSPELVLSKAALNAGRALGLTQAELGRVVGRDRTRLADGLSPESKAGELALLFVRCYRGIYALMGGSEANMRHWFATQNAHTHGIPKEQVQSVHGLVEVVNYLDAIRGKN